MEINVEQIKITPNWKKDKKQIWDEKFAPIMKKEKRINFVSFLSAAAAVLLVLVAFSFFYEISEVAPRGTQKNITLPDQSLVALNADSKISYKPLWWYINREVKMKGEAYFEVTPGSNFSVFSEVGTVQVLGTKFNVFSRDNIYKVSCVSGRVRVSVEDQRSILTKSMQTSWENKELKTKTIKDISSLIIWTQQGFFFEETPLKDVLSEISRRYNIKIKTKGSLTHKYTGQFSSTQNPQEILDVIAETFNIELIVQTN